MSERLPRAPAIFFGHGSPMNVLGGAYANAWRALGETFPKPRAILMISAHWYVPETAVTAMAQPRTIYDFYGFPPALYQIAYPAPGDPWLAGRVADLLSPLPVRADHDWGLDHGTWSVLAHAYPDADVPVVQLAIDGNQPPQFHYDLGRKLATIENTVIEVMALVREVDGGKLKAVQTQLDDVSARVVELGKGPVQDALDAAVEALAAVKELDAGRVAAVERTAEETLAVVTEALSSDGKVGAVHAAVLEALAAVKELDAGRLATIETSVLEALATVKEVDGTVNAHANAQKDHAAAHAATIATLHRQLEAHTTATTQSHASTLEQLHAKFDAHAATQGEHATLVQKLHSRFDEHAVTQEEHSSLVKELHAKFDTVGAPVPALSAPAAPVPSITAIISGLTKQPVGTSVIVNAESV